MPDVIYDSVYQRKIRTASLLYRADKSEKNHENKLIRLEKKSKISKSVYVRELATAVRGYGEKCAGFKVCGVNEVSTFLPLQLTK